MKSRPRSKSYHVACSSPEKVGFAEHRWLTQRGYQLVKRTQFNNWYIPEQEPFGLTSANERLVLFKKLYLTLLPRKIKECFKIGNLRPLSEH